MTAHWHSMFLRYYVEIPVPAAVAGDALMDGRERWIPALASDANERGHRLMAEVGFPVDGHRLGKRVQIELGAPVATAGRTWLPISWHATGPGELFPALEGELEVAKLGDSLTQLGLSARYRPPFGLLGESLDRVLLHRIAEATIRDFVERVAVNLKQQCGQAV